MVKAPVWKAGVPARDARVRLSLSPPEGSAHGGQLGSNPGPALLLQTDGSIPLPSSRL